MCGDFIADEHALRQHLVHEHGLSNSRPDAVSSRKRKPSDELEFLEWAPEDGLSSSKRTRFAISTINPRVLSEPTPAGYRADETECLTDSESDETLLDGCITGAVGSPQPITTNTCSADDHLFSEFLRSPSPSCMPIGTFSGHSSGTAVDPVSDEAIPEPTAKTPSGALDHDVVLILRLKGPKLSKGARKGRNKAS